MTSLTKKERPGYPTHTELTDKYADYIVKQLGTNRQSAMVTVALAESEGTGPEKIYIGISGTTPREQSFLDAFKKIVAELNNSTVNHPDGVKREVILAAPEQNDIAEDNVRLIRPRDEDTIAAQRQLAKAHAQVLKASSDWEKDKEIQTLLDNRETKQKLAQEDIFKKIKQIQNENENLTYVAGKITLGQFELKKKGNKTKIEKITQHINKIFSDEEIGKIYNEICSIDPQKQINLPKPEDITKGILKKLDSSINEISLQAKTGQS